MTNLNEVKLDQSVVHLLLVGDTKAGKSTYAAEAAIDGFNLIYFDSDNGLSALLHAIDKVADPAKRTEIKDRVNYFRITHPKKFFQVFFRSTAKSPLFWLPSTSQVVNAKSLGVDKNEEIWVFNAKAIKPSTILCIDSWTSLSQDALSQLRADQSAPLLEGTDQGTYGEAKSATDYYANILQTVPYHVIVQAHSTRYELYEKPANSTAEERKKQSAMKLIDTYEIPVSTSRAAGFDMGKRFNHIGWLSLGALSKVEIDFTRKPKRVGGGPPNRKDDTSKLSFKQLVIESKGPMPGDESDVAIETAVPWFTKMTFGQIASG